MKKILLLLITLFCVTIVSAQVSVVTSSSVRSIKVLKENKEIFLGVNAGIGTTLGKYFNSFDSNVGLDFAVANLKKTFACGFFASYQTIRSGSIGPLFLFGNNITNSAFIFGVGYAFGFSADDHIEIEGVNIDRSMSNKHGVGFRLGYQFSKSFYSTANIALGNVSVRDRLIDDDDYYYRLIDDSDCLLTSLSVSIGYKFNMHKNRKIANK